jgi:serine-type D-Ala-D-Ala carboxypeptidase/endopeptidase
MQHFTVTLSAIHSTTQDMMNYLQANVEERNPAIRLSHRQTWGDLNTFAVGITWDMEQYYGKYKQVWHSGYDYGSISLCTGYPSLNLGMWLWANDDSRQGNLYDMEREIRDNLLYLDSQRAK